MRAVGVLMLAGCAMGNMYDVIDTKKVPPSGGCKDWSDASSYDKYWVSGKPPAGAGASCAQQGKGPSNDHVDGSSCVSKSSGKTEPCTSAEGVPEQINVQIASPDTVVVAWVTFEAAEPSGAPTASYGTSAKSLTAVKGVTHKHTTHGGRVYYMHFVKLSGLTAKAKYYYKVQSGGSGAKESDMFSFRAPYGSGETRIALYGDMGVYTWNNMANLRKDCVEDEKFDLIIHAGDHCYNEGDDDERRADGYMEAFQQTIANVPWMPIVGNHEYYANAKLGRYLDSTWQKWDPLPGGEEWGSDGLRGASSATSALGAFLSTGNHHAAGVHGTVPSKTSRYFSVDFGLVHLVGLSLNGYNGVDDCTTECNQQQVAWLKKDLAAVDRAKTPWVIAMSHFPIYLSEKREPEDDLPMSGMAWLNAEECEFQGHEKTCKPKGWKPAHNVSLTLNDARGDLEPIFYDYGVDIYWAGHIHFYQTFHGPLKAGKVVSEGTHNPKGVIHACSGNGGPPSPNGCSGRTDKLCSSEYSYTRLTVYNTTDLLWEQVGNEKNEVFDSWTVHQDKHGPF